MPDFGARLPFTGPHGPVGPTATDDWHEAMGIAREYTPSTGLNDAERWEHDASRIRRALALKGYAGHTLEMSCFNNEDRDQIERRLTQQERRRVIWRVQFNWPETR
jgi:hypothetical protein